MLLGFSGYSFCKAHSTAYGVEAYAGAHLKRYFPAEFLAAILSNGKGFYSALAYTLVCRGRGIGFASPDTNASRRGYFAEHDTLGARIRVPLAAIKDLTTSTLERWECEKDRRPFDSMQDFFVRVNPDVSEMQNLIRVGVFDSFGETRTAQIWSLHRLARWRPEGAQGVLFAHHIETELPDVPLSEPTALERLRAEHELLGYTVSGHPLNLYPEVAWATYLPDLRPRKLPERRGDCLRADNRRPTASSGYGRDDEVHFDMRLQRHRGVRTLRPNIPRLRHPNRPLPCRRDHRPRLPIRRRRGLQSRRQAGGAAADSTSACGGGVGGGCKIGTRSFPSRAICSGVAACVTTLSSR